MTALTLFDLVVRSMRKNIKHYYLYFFALIFSVSLYFVFATLQQDSAVAAETLISMKMKNAFAAAGILLIVIAGIFVIYANAIFLRRRSREIGLYQLIGLTKGNVARMLIIENALLSAGALLVGMGAGLLVSRVFLLLLMKLVGFDGFISLSFSMKAVIQTSIVFLAIILLTSAQMLFAVYRNTLLGLFNAEKAGEYPKKPKAIRSAILALLGMGLIGFGYWLSGRMINALFFFNMLAVLATTILGTYLVFRVTISWLMYQIRVRKDGHLGLYNSLSLASLMHRMKGNANSLTIITTLSAMTLAMLAGAYSLYYSTEKDSRKMMPYDFMFSDESSKFKELSGQFLQELDSNGVLFTTTPIEMVPVAGQFEGLPNWFGDKQHSVIVNAKQLREAGLDIGVKGVDTAIIHDSSLEWMLSTLKPPFEITLSEDLVTDEGQKEFRLIAEEVGSGNVLNYPAPGVQIVVENALFEELQKDFLAAGEESGMIKKLAVKLKNPDQLEKAADILAQQKYSELPKGYYTLYRNQMEDNGLLIFIAGFLGLVFLISTGSILYFKQMTEAEQEKRSYATLRQLGFTVQDIMRGIIRKQVFVFGLPLLIGLMHSIFAIKSASFIFMSDITIPAAIAMGLYVLIYLIFAFLTVGYYRKTVKAAL
ncbi:FtsX-like permease family protein [Sporosarcina sp. FSL W7-1349]|uniref:FtsX-like permease family protein n=1 Tax=Sporosarcina sp. FSL W7-1349 TaxID=2921561 RepID=UPI0030F9022D